MFTQLPFHLGLTQICIIHIIQRPVIPQQVSEAAPRGADASLGRRPPTAARTGPRHTAIDRAEISPGTWMESHRELSQDDFNLINFSDL